MAALFFFVIAKIFAFCLRKTGGVSNN